MIVDASARKSCLDITQSFIVEAPAGSGKTSLLVQRFLALLANVEHAPEECLAITFTKRAAQEMQKRIIEALLQAEENIVPTSEYEKITFALAKAVLKREQTEKWNLIENPNRLKIQTLDSFCYSIVKAMPIATHFGGEPTVTDDPGIFYQKAVDNLFQDINSTPLITESFENLLLYLDNDWDKLKVLFQDMLYMREQWLDNVVTLAKILKHDESAAKKQLEIGLSLEITNILLQLQDLKPSGPTILNNIPKLANYAAKNLIQAKTNIGGEEYGKYICACESLNSWPEALIDRVQQWRGIAELLLAKNGSLRKTVTKVQGFVGKSAKSKQCGANLKNDQEFNALIKQEMLDVLKELVNYPEFINKLHELTILPKQEYSVKEWSIIKSIIVLLPILVGHLHLVFQEHSAVDFTEVSLSALHALGNELEPSDLALALGYKINHILFDEFQDTSILQFNLLKKLTASWHVGDNKTLFLVGDPQQSIYSFRQAEVSLFLLVKKYGIENIPINLITLNTNFRSSVPLVKWFNDFFIKVFPLNDDFTNGAVKFTASVSASKSLSPEPYVQLIDVSDNSKEKISKGISSNITFTESFALDAGYQFNLETNNIIKIIKQEQNLDPNKSIAILVRSRTHIKELLYALKVNNITFLGREIEALETRLVVRDLLSLTKAILHLGDRIAWLAILKAPWCGLSLNDLHILATFNNHGLVWQSILDPEVIKHLSPDGVMRLSRLKIGLLYALENLGRMNVRDLVYNTWQKLNGQQLLTNNIEKDDADSFFDFLAIHANNKELYTVNFLDKKIAKLYAKSRTFTKNPVQIMTIHKAKGLEFDVVILPYLHKKPANKKQQLFLWQEKTYRGSVEYLLFAPIIDAANSSNTSYNYVKYNLLKKEQMEALRMLYVAITRAKTKLYLIFNSDKIAKKSLYELASSGF